MLVNAVNASTYDTTLEGIRSVLRPMALPE